MAKITKEMALDYHRYPRPGKTEVIPTKPYSSQQDLSLAYSPGVAYPCLEIKENPDDSYLYTNRSNLVGVISNGTAVLGLGNIGAEAGKPVMEGKALLFKIFAGLDGFDIEINETDPDKFVEIVKSLVPTFGGINLEDIKAPECFHIEDRLKAECDIPIMHDDQHGTAIISAAGLINALELQGKKADEIRLVVNGAGAAAIACANLYIALGVKPENIVMCDSKGAIHVMRQDLNERKRRFATSRDVHTLAEAMAGADVFLGLSVKDVLTPDMIQSMAPRPIVFALANPDPEIEYSLAMASRDDLIFATGRSDYPNQINNVLGFPYIFRGALDTRATEINEAMKLAAVYAIASLAKEPVPTVVEKAYGQKGMEFGRNYILPKPLDPRLLLTVAPAVARAAIESGVARRKIDDWDEYRDSLTRVTGFDNKLTRGLLEEAKRYRKKVVFGEGNTDHTLLAAVDVKRQGIGEPVLLGNAEMIAARAARLGADISGIEIVNPRHDDSAPMRQEFAEKLAARRHRQGVTVNEAVELMYDRNYFGMMMVDSGYADAFIAGAYAGSNRLQRLAGDVIGIRDGYKSFASMHVIETKRGTLFLADTATNELNDEDTLIDVTRLAASSVSKFTTDEPVIALVSYSNFGSSHAPESAKMHNVIDRLHAEEPALAVDGEMQVNYALNAPLRDRVFPFNRIKGKHVNTLVFPNLSAANTATRLLLEMGVGESIGPIQMGLKRPVHFVKVDAPVRDIVNLAAVAVIDAALSNPA